MLWNLLILLVFFIGGIAFLIYYYKVKDVKRIEPYKPEPPAEQPKAEEPSGEETDNKDNTEEQEKGK